MNSVIFRDEDVLNEMFRYSIIKEIEGHENRKRKAVAYRRFEILRDKTKKYVMERLRDQGFSDDTLRVMEARASNISVAKKIVKKKARTYNSGVDRNIPGDEAGTLAVQELADILGVNDQFKKGDEYMQLSRNAAVYPHPVIDHFGENFEGGQRPIYSLTVRTLHPHSYDVIPDGQNRERARCFILSDFPAGDGYNYCGAMEYVPGGRGGHRYNGEGDGMDQVIADTPSDDGANGKHYIWWTSKYHFTTDRFGKIILQKSPLDLQNPIGLLPPVNLAKDQDGSFWGEGGDDIIDGAILANIFLTDAASILNMQGWGQPVMIGNNLKDKEYKVGPQNVLELSTNPGDDSKPDFKIVSTDPHTDAWLRILEVYIALLLTTNNLSPRNIQGKLEASSISSGIAKMVDESESTEDINESQGYFIKREREFWVRVQKWLEVFRSAESLVPELETLPDFDGSEVNVRFKSQGVVLSEKEKLEIIELRKKLGINTMIELLKIDDPSLSDKEAEVKLRNIAKDQLIKMATDEAEAEMNKEDPNAEDQEEA